MKILEPEFVHTDPRRSLKQLLTADIKQVNVYNVSTNSVLGNHYHKETTEYFYVVKGSIFLELHDMKTGQETRRIFTNGDMFAVHPYEVHKIECFSEAKIMTFLTKEFTQENPDLYKVAE